jgi:hypothetical protein
MYQITVYSKTATPPVVFDATDASMAGNTPNFEIPEGEIEPIINPAHVAAIVKRKYADHAEKLLFGGPEVADGRNAMRVLMNMATGVTLNFVAQSYRNLEGIPVFDWFDDHYQILAIDPQSIATMSVKQFTVENQADEKPAFVVTDPAIAEEAQA